MSQLTDLLNYFNHETLQLIFRSIEELRSVRNQRIRTEFNGHNHQELAEKYQIDIRHLHRIIQLPRHDIMSVKK